MVRGKSMGAFKAEDAGFRQGYQSYQEKVPMGYSIGVEVKGGVGRLEVTSILLGSTTLPTRPRSS